MKAAQQAAEDQGLTNYKITPVMDESGEESGEYTIENTGAAVHQAGKNGQFGARGNISKETDGHTDGWRIQQDQHREAERTTRGIRQARPQARAGGQALAVDREDWLEIVDGALRNRVTMNDRPRRISGLAIFYPARRMTDRSALMHP